LFKETNSSFYGEIFTKKKVSAQHAQRPTQKETYMAPPYSSVHTMQKAILLVLPSRFNQVTSLMARLRSWA